ncbi:MAG: serine/threonine-protein kinase [Actinomycetota bacterium]
MDLIGSLWRAEDAFLKWPVTIRVLRDGLGANERFRQVLRAELRTVWPRLEHPNIANAIYYDELQERPCFVVMQALDGETLAQRLSRSGMLERWEAMRIASQAQEALAAAHEIGLVHGGLTPDSVVLTQGGPVKVIDFGIPTALWLTAREAWTTLPAGSRAHLKEPAARAPDRSVDARGLELLRQQMISAPKVAAEDDPSRLVDVALVPGLELLRQRMISAPEVAAEDDPSRLVDVALATRSQTAGAVVRRPQRSPWRRRHVLAGIAPLANEPWRALARWGRWAGRSVLGGTRAVASAPARGARVVVRIPRQARVSTIAVSALSVALTATAVVVLTSPPSSRGPLQRPLAARTTPSSPTPQTLGVTVPEVEGLSAMEAGMVLDRVGLLVIDAEPTPGPPGKVVGTDPAVSAIVQPGTPIILYVGASSDRLRDES